MRAIHNVAAKVDTSPTKFSAHGFQEFGRNQSRERQFCIQSEFVGVEVAAVFPRFDFADLPFVCEVGFDGESFGAAEEVAMSHGMKELVVNVKGPGMGRDSAIRSLQAMGFVVTAIVDVTPVPHNGCRAPKRRRV